MSHERKNQYGEPWSLEINSPVDGKCFIGAIASDKYTAISLLFNNEQPDAREISRERLQRMVRCVNACAGIPDEALTQDIVGGVTRAMEQTGMNAVVKGECPACGGALRQDASGMVCDKCGYCLR